MFDTFFGAVVIVNGFVIAVQTDANADYDLMFFAVSNVFLVLYIGELTARVLADPGGAFRSGWNQFDFTLICMSRSAAGYCLSRSCGR